MSFETKIAKTTWTKTALKAGFGVSACAMLSWMPSVASAQTVTETVPAVQTEVITDTDTPLAGNTEAHVGEAEDLPQNLQPEQLSVPQEQTLTPTQGVYKRAARRNSWNPDTLTQSTGLSAASFQIASSQRVVEKGLEATPRATDMISAQDLLNIGDLSVESTILGLRASSRADGVVALNAGLQGSLFDLPVSDNLNSSMFKLGLAEQPCLGTSEECQLEQLQNMGLGYAKNITHGKPSGFNIQLTPRAGVRFDEDSKSALVGALFRIGDNLREGSERKSNAWYFFASADAEAVNYTPNSARRLTSGDFHLQNRIVVGDAQAGLGYRLGNADLALTYYKRQARAENYKFDEDAAALSITWKR